MKNLTANVIRVYDLYHQLMRISDTWSEAWSFDDMKRIAKLHMDSTSDAAYVRVSMIDGTEYVDHNPSCTMIRIPYTAGRENNLKRLEANDTPCLLCGRAVKNEAAPSIRTWEGAWVVLEDQVETLNPNGDSGYWPIGLDCLKNHPELQAYV